jgi:hypothetical protein
MRPVRAKPGCTSSAMNTPPALRTASTAGARKPAGSGNTPSLEKIESTIRPATRWPRFSSFAVALPTALANPLAMSWP